jgi:two-component system, LytTR family, sensor kinase
MKKKGLLLFASFIAFYLLIHSIRHLPEILHGRLSWKGETTYMLSIVRIVADMVIACLFTLFPYLLLYYFYPQKKFKLIAVGMIVSLTTCFFIGFWWTGFMEHDPVRLSNYLPQAIFFCIVNAVFGMIFYFVRYTQYKELQEKETALQNKQSELSFLRSQVNPHFLFNNLNNIYSLVYYKSDQALTAISGLSELLRYMLYDANDTVMLTTEIAYVEKYIALQQLRFEHPSDVEFKISGELDPVNIPPLLLIPFIENAFKHGDDLAKNWLKISIKTARDNINFYCSNKKAKKKHDATGGIGITNVKRRLALLYPEKHTLEITEDDELFVVKLNLDYGK